MEFEKIESRPVNVPVAKLTVNQEELDTLLALVGRTNNHDSDVDLDGLYTALQKAGGNAFSKSSVEIGDKNGMPTVNRKKS